jgi:glycosyltransferase involved in cell wall biosynthesis
MKITLIGPGKMPIPPKDFGGVESLMWDYHNELIDRGHQVTIVNTEDLEGAIEAVNSSNPDFVHLHYDAYAHIMPHIKCKNRAVTSHYPYLENPEPQYAWILNDFALLSEHENIGIISLSDGIAEAFVNAGVAPENSHVIPCAINTKLFAFNSEAEVPDRSIYLAKIEPRKRQHMFQHADFNIDFAGPITDNRFHHQNKNYIGVLNKQKIYDTLTRWANLVLLSDGEGHARVCLEGMAAGLGLVVSEQATANLDTSKPFIDVIPQDKINDREFVKRTIEKNREASCSMRKEIRDYCIKKFSWDSIIGKYEKAITSIRKEK